MNKILALGKILLCLQLLVLGQTSIAAASKTEAVSGISPELILHYINEYRAKKHLAPLKMNRTISSIAAKHSRDMATKAIPFGHKYYNKRFQYMYKEINDCTSAAENVAYWRTNAKNLVDAWVASLGHRKNIEGNYNLTGIGIAYGKKGWAYYTELFARTTPNKSSGLKNQKG